MNQIIRVQNLTKKFEGITALHDLSFTVPEGAIFGILGPNGAGKTTTVRLLNGLLTPSEGEANIFGKNVWEHGDEIRQRCGVQTDTNLYEKLSARDNLSIWGHLFGMSGDALSRRIDDLLNMFGLDARQNDLVGNFSKGMRQKLSIARAIIHDPGILFLDEPTAGLDPEAAFDVLHYLQEYDRDAERTVLLCSHRLEEVEMLCQEILILDQGTKRAEGTIPELTGNLWPRKKIIVALEEITDSIADSLSHKNVEFSTDTESNQVTISIDRRDDIPDCVNILVSAGARIYSVREEEHSLYDVYFHLISEENHASVRA